jgi:hypothetical protein
MLTTEDLYWVAGMLEGEGSFIITNGALVISMGTTDEDIAKRVAKILGAYINGPYQDKRFPNNKPVFKLAVRRHEAHGWMMTLFSLMSKRRQAKIKELLLKYYAKPTKPFSQEHKDRLAASIRKFHRGENAVANL